MYLLSVCVYQGMGGQHGYFGLWLDSDFGRGHSRARPKCTTYGSPQLSAEEDFSLESMEVWAVGKPSEPEDVGQLYFIYFQPSIINRKLKLLSTSTQRITFTFQQSSPQCLCFCVTGWRGGWQKKCPGHGSRSAGHYGDDREESAQPGAQGTRGRPGWVSTPWISKDL